MRLEIAVNQLCNAACEHCNRAIGLAKFNELEMTAEQMGRAVDTMNEQETDIHHITFGGGEPVMNKQLQGILDHAARLTCLKRPGTARVLTNDMPSTIELRDSIRLPDIRFRWVPSPLRNPTDPKSGKDSHEPFFISPKDLGLTSKFEKCTVKGWCGKGLDACGWSMCGIAGTLGRLLGINPYTHKGFTREETPGICQHCIYGLEKDDQKSIFERARNGKIPAISETYSDGLTRYRKEPKELERF